MTDGGEENVLPAGDYITTAILLAAFLLGIRLMRKPRTARMGNLLSGGGLLVSVWRSLAEYGLVTAWLPWIALAAGALVGAWLAWRVRMVQMPQCVALLNGLGGAASSLVALSVMISATVFASAAARLSSALALVLGMATLVGSLIAAGKLAGILRQQPVILPGHRVVNVALLAACALGIPVVTTVPAPMRLPASLVALTLAGLFGIVTTLRIGGADMPVTISLLNACSGLAAAVAGLALDNSLLVGTGAIVGAGGLVLTQAMSRAMNRSLMDILTGNAQTAPARAVTSETKTTEENPPATADGEPTATEPASVRAAALLQSSRNVIIVPGYGMALAQAQHQVKALADRLSAMGVEVTFAIHPVAGRMPGHMHVLLAEAGVDYEKLQDLEPANAAFPSADVVVVVGANDVINPAARTAEGTPIYGMPVLDITKAANVIVCNKDVAPGYAGVPNPIYENPEVVLLLGDAAILLRELTDSLEPERVGHHNHHHRLDRSGFE